MKHYNSKQIVKPTFVGPYVQLGKDSRIWRFCNIYGTKEHPIIIGEGTQIGGCSEIKPGVKIGNFCRCQYGLFVPEGVTIGNYVFIGPRVTFTNDKYPDVPKTMLGEWKMENTEVSDYVSIGANVVINPGINISHFAQIGSGAVVTRDVPFCAIVVGNPARQVADIRDKKFREKYSTLVAIADSLNKADSPMARIVKRVK